MRKKHIRIRRKYIIIHPLISPLLFFFQKNDPPGRIVFLDRRFNEFQCFFLPIATAPEAAAAITTAITTDASTVFGEVAGVC